MSNVAWAAAMAYSTACSTKGFLDSLRLNKHNSYCITGHLFLVIRKQINHSSIKCPYYLNKKSHWIQKETEQNNDRSSNREGMNSEIYTTCLEETA